jgi:hypothetical protein
MDGRPAPAVASKEATWAFSVESSNFDLGDAVTGVAGHVSNSLHRKLTLSSDSLSHFDPFGTEFCEPGRVDHPTLDFGFRISDCGFT